MSGMGNRAAAAGRQTECKKVSPPARRRTRAASSRNAARHHLGMPGRRIPVLNRLAEEIVAA
jgi:hypothetical protein